MTDAAYSPELLAHFRSPANAGSLPREAPDVVTGEAGDADDGRLVRLQLRLGPGDEIVDVRFKAFGCPATIACASWLGARIRGCAVSEARALTAGRIAEALTLAPERYHAAELAIEALQRALQAAITAGR